MLSIILWNWRCMNTLKCNTGIKGLDKQNLLKSVLDPHCQSSSYLLTVVGHNGRYSLEISQLISSYKI